MIHKSVIISETAKISDNVEIGPFSIIGDHVEIGEGTRINSHVVINGPTIIGSENHIYQFTSIGDDPQDKKYRGHHFTDKKIAEILNFIDFNLLEPEKLTVGYLSQKFNISKNYFSEYFKRNTSQKFQDYLICSKLRIAGARAKFTDVSFQEIASELGFTDSSHLNRMMKKYTGKGMRETRKEIQNNRN